MNAPAEIVSDVALPATPVAAKSSTRLRNRIHLIGFTLAFGLLLMMPSLLSDFRLSLLARFLCYAIVAIALDLIWGYTGILSLGHGVYFGLGAYCAAMYLKLEASHGKMPDFMAWSGVDAMPWWWQPFAYPGFALGMAVLVPTVLAAALGFLTFRSRIKGVFFSILSQALAIVVVTLFIGQQGNTGGTNGMTDFKTLLGHDLNDVKTQHFFYFLTVVTLALIYLGCRALVSGKVGKLLVAIRDGENRVRFMGYDPVMFKTFVYALSAALAGIAGVLFVLQIGLITPTEMDITHSIRMVLWVALGGRGTLIGAILGALLVNFGENALSEKYPMVWSFLVGAAFLATVLFLPNGLIGLAKDLSARWKNRGIKE